MSVDRLAREVAEALWGSAPPKIEGGSDRRAQWIADVLAVQIAFHVVGEMAAFMVAMHGYVTVTTDPDGWITDLREDR